MMIEAGFDRSAILATAALKRRLPNTISPVSRRTSKSPEGRHCNATIRFRLISRDRCTRAMPNGASRASSACSVVRIKWLRRSVNSYST